MPELPEIRLLARQMDEHLRGKKIVGIEVLQPKCLNVTQEAFEGALGGATIRSVCQRGKWMLADTDGGWLLLNLGMGGEILLVDRAHMPEKYRLAFDFAGGSTLAINFWWFGYAHYAAPDGLAQHAPTAKLGPDALDVTRSDLAGLMRGKRGNVKSIITDQAAMAGIGNAYVHDILFLARLHPRRVAASLSAEELDALFDAIHRGLEPSIAKGGASYEKNLFGAPGGFTADDILVGYREGQPCPRCSTPIEKIKTGSTTSFICPRCQPELGR